jgi:short-subunit dehydrogenase
MENFYRGKVVVVTGASSGIGKALALHFASCGAKVVIGARNEENLKLVVDEIRANGGEAQYCVMDVTDLDLCQNLVDTAVIHYRKIDIFINNAGISMRALFKDVELDVLHKLMDVNFWGTVNCTKCALPYLLESKGTLVGISSIAGIHGLPGRTGYSASKYAMIGFLETVRIENLKNDLQVMVAIPGFTSSNIRFNALTADGSMQGETPRKEEKMMSAELAAQHIALGIRNRKTYMTLDLTGKTVYSLKRFITYLLDRTFYSAMAKEPNSPLV